MVDVAKLRGFQQRTGRRGEDAFRPFASRNGLLATKVEEDMGFDFLCQVEDGESGSMRRMSGALVGVSVRSSARKPVRVHIDRSDAQAMLQAKFLVILAVIEVTPRAETVYYRILDEGFATELVEFLASTRKSMSFTPNDCRTEDLFATDLNAALTTSLTERIRVAVTRKRLRVHLPDIDLVIQQRADGELSVVEVTNFYDLFLRDTTPKPDAVHAATFGSPRLRMNRLMDLGPKPELMHAVGDLANPVLVGATAEGDIDILAINSHGRARTTFQRVENATHRGWVHPAGFSITLSVRHRQDHEYVHDLDTVLDPDEDLLLGDHPDLWAFLEQCTPDAILKVADSGANGGLEASYVSGLHQAHCLSVYLRAAAKLPGFDARVVPLRLAADHESLDSLAWLAEVSRRPGVLDGFGMLLGTASDFEGPAPVSLPAGLELESAMVAVAANLGDRAVVTWLKADMAVWKDKEQTRGLRIASVRGVRVGTCARLEKASEFAELVVHPSLPTIALTPDGPKECQTDASQWDLDTEA